MSEQVTVQLQGVEIRSSGGLIFLGILGEGTIIAVELTIPQAKQLQKALRRAVWEAEKEVPDGGS